MYEEFAKALLQERAEKPVCVFPANPSLAMAYVPMQRLNGTYDLEEAFARGTLFPDLDKPFLAYRGAVK